MKKPSVLFIEDNDIHREMFIHLGERKGFDVDCATDGKSGLEMMSRKEYDVIFLDMLMPGMCGEDFINTYTGNKKVIVLSAIGCMSSVKKFADKENVCDVWSKPFDPCGLAERVFECFNCKKCG